MGSKNGRNLRAICRFSIAKLAFSAFLFATPVFAADSIEGQVLGGGAPIRLKPAMTGGSRLVQKDRLTAS